MSPERAPEDPKRQFAHRAALAAHVEPAQQDAGVDVERVFALPAQAGLPGVGPVGREGLRVVVGVGWRDRDRCEADRGQRSETGQSATRDDAMLRIRVAEGAQPVGHGLHAVVGELVQTVDQDQTGGAAQAHPQVACRIRGRDQRGAGLRGRDQRRCLVGLGRRREVEVRGVDENRCGRIREERLVAGCGLAGEQGQGRRLSGAEPADDHERVLTREHVSDAQGWGRHRCRPARANREARG